MHRATVTCPHQSASIPLAMNRFACALMLYGGSPYLGNCIDCIRGGENNPDGAARILGATETTHPPHRDAVSGCCDTAEP